MTKMTVDKINLMDSEQKCLTLAKNAEKQNRPDLAEAANLRAARLKADSDIKNGRRPDIDYHLIGLKNGTVIIMGGIDEECEVFTNRTLLYKGSEIYITPLADKLIEDGHPRKLVMSPWFVKDTGELLNDLYEATYGNKKN